MIEELEKFALQNFVVDDDVIIEFDMNIIYKGNPLNVHIIFDDYDPNNPRTVQFISDNIFFLKNNIEYLVPNIDISLQEYIQEHYEIDISKKSVDIKLFSIQFSGGLSNHIFGDSFFWFDCSFEDEHVIEIEFKHWKAVDINIV